MRLLVTTAPRRAVFSCAWDGIQIAGIVCVICAACTVTATKFQPTVYAVIEPPVIVKLQDRINKEKS